jgi:hypothetical protein
MVTKKIRAAHAKEVGVGNPSEERAHARIKASQTTVAKFDRRNIVGVQKSANKYFGLFSSN